MKKLVTSYTFNATAKTIVSADFVSLDAILLITNVTDNVIVYNFAGAGQKSENQSALQSETGWPG